MNESTVSKSQTLSDIKKTESFSLLQELDGIFSLPEKYDEKNDYFNYLEKKYE